MWNKDALRIAKESVAFAALFTLLIIVLDSLYSEMSPILHYAATFVAALLIHYGLMYMAELHLVRRAK